LSNQAYEGQKPGEIWMPFLGGAANWLPQETTWAHLSTPDSWILTDYGREMEEFAFEQADELTRLRKEYVLDTDPRVEAFLCDHRSLLEVLLDAVVHLKTTFGKECVFKLRLGSNEDDGPRVLCGIVQWKMGLCAARVALETFDESWWIENSRRASGRLSFDYELA